MSTIARGQVTIATVEDGAAGQPGAAAVYRGLFSSTAIYYNNALRRDVVKYNDSFYIYKGTNGVRGTWKASNWESFGGQYDSVATSLLLAEFANLGGFIFAGGKLISQKGTLNGVESTNYENPDFVPYIVLDGTNGTSQIHNGEFFGGVRTIFHYINSTNCIDLGGGQYKVGDNLETEGLSIRAYSGNTHFDISSGLDCSPTVLNTAGSQTITVTYADKTCTFTVKVTEEKEVIQTVTVAARPTKVEYTVGDRLDSTGLTLRVVTNKGTKEVTSGFSCSPKVLTTAGTQTVTVAYGQYTCTFDVTVKAAASPSPSPTPTPTPSASPAVSASPSADPVAVSPSPSAGRHDNGSNPVSAVVKVGLIVAVLALAGLAGCVYVLQKKGNVDFLSMFTGKNKQDRGRH